MHVRSDRFCEQPSAAHCGPEKGREDEQAFGGGREGERCRVRIKLQHPGCAESLKGARLRRSIQGPLRGAVEMNIFLFVGFLLAYIVLNVSTVEFGDLLELVSLLDGVRFLGVFVGAGDDFVSQGF